MSESNYWPLFIRSPFLFVLSLVLILTAQFLVTFSAVAIVSVWTGKIITSFLDDSVPSTEKDIDTQLTKAWTAIDKLSIIWKSDLTDKMKRSFFRAAVVSIQLYGCTTWTLTKRLEKKLDGNYTRMLRAILNKS